MTIEDWRMKEFEAEAAATERINDAIDHLVGTIAAYPHSWMWGDGKGGAILQRLWVGLEQHGMSRCDPPSPKPARKAMTATLTLATFKRDSYCCVACGSRDDLTVDHIVPVANGGENVFENLQTLCRPCNTSKGTKSMDEWQR